ncbi:Serine/threonine-protein kinase mph1 [Hordeum vulgare]|nr:Serine/threonine-protein kinase mph1 [Hordeum vulgare]
MPSPCVMFGEMPTSTPTIKDPLYNQFMEYVIYEGRGETFQMGGHGDAFDLEETQSQDGCGQFVSDEDFEANDHGDSWHGDDDIYCGGEGDEEEEGSDIVGESLFIDELTQIEETQKRRRVFAFQSLEAFKTRHNDKPFTLTHCWRIINNFPKFKDQYRELQRNRGNKTAALAGGGDSDALKRPRSKTSSKIDDKRDVASFALHETLHDMMSQKEKFEMEEAAKKRKIDMKEASRQRQLNIEATNATTKAKEVALAIMRVDLIKMRKKTRSWFEARQKEMFDADGLN